MLQKIKKLYTYYKDDFALIYSLYKEYVSGVINEYFSDYIKQIEEEKDEKLQKKLKIVGLIYKKGLRTRK